FLIAGACQGMDLRPGSLGHVAVMETLGAVERRPDISWLEWLALPLMVATFVPPLSGPAIVAAAALSTVRLGYELSAYFRQRTEYLAADPYGPLGVPEPSVSGVVWAALFAAVDVFLATKVVKGLAAAASRLMRARALRRELVSEIDQAMAEY